MNRSFEPNLQPLLQIFNIKQVSAYRSQLSLSDGTHLTHFVVLVNDHSKNNGLVNFTIIKLLDFEIAEQEGQALLVVKNYSVDWQRQPCRKIGTPIVLASTLAAAAPVAPVEGSSTAVAAPAFQIRDINKQDVGQIQGVVTHKSDIRPCPNKMTGASDKFFVFQLADNSAKIDIAVYGENLTKKFFDILEVGIFLKRAYRRQLYHLI